MSKPRLSETQIIALLKEAESGVPVPELCRRHNVGKAVFINGVRSLAAWKRRMFAVLKSLKTRTLGSRKCTPT